jgi:hypothetical protein
MNAIKHRTADDLVSDIAALMVEYYEMVHTSSTHGHSSEEIFQNEDDV